MSLITTGEAAAKLGVSEQTIRGYFDQGLLTGHILPSGHYRIDAASVDQVRDSRRRVSSTLTVVDGRG